MSEDLQTVSAPSWRVFFLRWSLRFNAANMPKRANFCWRISRFWARESTHQALAANFVALMIFGEP